jgi:WD40 repeat protein
MTPGLRILALSTLGLLSPGLALGEEQTSAPPVLRLETGMHTGPIRAAAVDAGGHLLATASFDKTVRLWSLPTGERRLAGRAFRGGRRLDRVRVGEGQQPLRV